MQESKFFNEHNLNPEAQLEALALRDSFLAAEYITPELLENTARVLAAEVERIAVDAQTEGEQATLVLEFLGIEQLATSLDFPVQSQPRQETPEGYEFFLQPREGGEAVLLTSQEIEEALAPIRDRVLSRLENRGVLLHGVVSRLKESAPNLWRLHDGNILKRQKFFSKELNASERQGHIEALSKLYSLERNPFIAYATLKADSAGFAEILAPLDFITLKDLLKDAKGLNPSGHIDLIRYFLDAVRGTEFLVNHDLRLSDLAPRNIAIHEGRGKLFDFDGLYSASYPVEHYLSDADHAPPERWKKSPQPITDAEMIFELGKTLEEITNEMPPLRFIKSKRAMRQLVHEMLTTKSDGESMKDRKKLLTLGGVIERLEGILRLWH